MALLKTQWIHSDQIAILRGNTVVAAPKVEYYKDRSKFLETKGNRKTKDVFGMINVISNGCFRACTGFGNCETPCYEKCYANESVYALKNKYNGFNICKNGINNEYFHLHLPAGDKPNYKLNTLKFWRVGSESSDMSLALSLNIVEPWIENNLDKFFTGISSDYFFVPAKYLRKIADYDNTVIGHTVSTWFADDDIQNRLTQIERYQDYGIPTMVWVATNSEWIVKAADKKRHNAMMKKILKLVKPQQIIEVPFHHRHNYNGAMLNLNPLGACCDSETHTCKSCKVLCGVPFLRSLKK